MDPPDEQGLMGPPGVTGRRGSIGSGATSPVGPACFPGGTGTQGCPGLPSHSSSGECGLPGVPGPQGIPGL